jgi:carbamoyl-phosphate synthase large subunit
MLTILVSGASGVIGYGILKSLRQSHPESRLVGISVYERSAARAFCDVFEKAPMTNHEDYISWLVELIKQYNVSLAIPGIEVDVVAWSEHRATIEQSEALVLLNNPELIRLCSDKWLFYQRLVENNSPYAIPTTLVFDEELQQFPLLLKPRKGSGSQGITIVNNQECLEEYLVDIGPKMMIQPVIGTAEEEYTTSAFFDLNSRLCASSTLKRRLSQAGFTDSAETVEVDNIENALVHLSEIFMPVGPTNFQFRIDKGQLKLLEINPRISSATSIRTAFGYNESAMSVEFYLRNITPTQPILKRGWAIRYSEDIIYYDSTDF